MKDYFTAIDEMAKEPFVDKDRLGCVGASFGGFSVYWLAGHHDKRFKAFIAHDGIFNMEMQYLETEEKWFANWDMGGAYWEKNNGRLRCSRDAWRSCRTAYLSGRKPLGTETSEWRAVATYLL